MRKKAAAWKSYTKPAMVEMVLNTLPQMTAEIAAPLCNVKRVQMISTGDGEIGVSKLTREVLDIVSRLPIMVEQLTGVNISDSCREKKH